MKGKKALPLFIFLFIFFHIFTINVKSLGIAVSQKNFDFIPNHEFVVDVNVICENREMYVDVYAIGELSEYITFNEPTKSIKLMPNEIRRFTFTLKLPEKFEKPGPHKAVIYALEAPPPEYPGAISARVQVGIPITVNVPYPGKYVEIENIGIENPASNQNVRFSVFASSLGEDNISNAKILIQISDADNKSIATLESDSKPMKSRSKETFYLTWFANVNPGPYKVSAKVIYDGIESNKFEKNFNIGAPSIKILELISEPIISGTIGKITAKVKSEWNEKISNVYLELKINGVTTLTSPTVSVEPWEEKNIDVFWDTSGVEPKEYEALAILHYLGKTEEKEIKLLVKKGFSTIGIIATLPIEIIALIVIIALIILALVYKRLRAKR